ncbi:MAG: hypothetical protein FH748_10915 [Balneolaceae bacterium]|nr:hypothetical protein [Balneolaceae bacterium]
MDCGLTCLRVIAKHHGRNYSLEALRKQSGVNAQDLNFIYIILVAQIMLFVRRTAAEFICPWVLLYLSTCINISSLAIRSSTQKPLPLYAFKYVLPRGWHIHHEVSMCAIAFG